MATKKVHFLHIPKTAGQSVHHLLNNSFQKISPLRVNAQFDSLGIDSVSNVDVISGHIDWNTMLIGGEAEFTFTVLRKPIDRILSFYHYLRSEAQKLSEEELAVPERIGMYKALHCTPNEYFCSNDEGFAKFISNHYDNFYTYFFASKTYDGHSQLSTKFSEEELLGKAIKNISKVDKVYTLKTVKKLPADLYSIFEDRSFEELPHVNKGDSFSTEKRIDELKKIGEHNLAMEKIYEMCELDNVIFNIFDNNF